HFAGEQSAVEGVLPDGRTTAICGPVARRGEDGGTVPGVRRLAQDRLQDLPALQGLRARRTDRSLSPALPPGEPAALSDREADRAAQAGATQLGRSEDPREV